MIRCTFDVTRLNFPNDQKLGIIQASLREADANLRSCPGGDGYADAIYNMAATKANSAAMTLLQRGTAFPNPAAGMMMGCSAAVTDSISQNPGLGRVIAQFE
jgi:hypothetical protein